MKSSMQSDISTQSSRPYAKSDSRTDGPGPRVMGATTLVGDEVCNRQDESLGKIHEIMLDTVTGHIAYAVLASGGFLGMGDKYFAIPWELLELDTDNKQFVLNISKDELRQAPGFDKDHWPSMADTNWAEEVHGFYKTTPYWERY
jgi:sporulation protein YlmC with PRC-barrel domain